MNREHHIVAIYYNTSQLDEPVYAAFSLRSGLHSATVIYWNDFGLKRTRPDPELGVIPQFEAAASNERFHVEWLDSRREGWRRVVQRAVQLCPARVIINDLPLSSKLMIATALRARGISVGFRSDKNYISAAPRKSASPVEKFVYGCFFDYFYYVGELSREYYGLSIPSVLFPYPCNTEKFVPVSDEVRADTRKALKVPFDAKVVLAVIKLNEREGALECIRIIVRGLKEHPDARAFIVGSGPLEAAIRGMIQESGCAERVSLTGYVPYAQLQHYFFASDIFVHFAATEPWGVSVVDALCGGLAVLASDRVGAAVELLRGEPEAFEFIVPFRDPELATQRLMALLASDDPARAFRNSRQRTLARYSAIATANRLPDGWEP